MLYFNTVSPSLLNIIRAVSGEPMFQDFRLVGGTALSLYLGHRMSVDADFFSATPFNQQEAVLRLSNLLPGIQVLKSSPHGFAAVFEGVKLDLYTWNTPFLLPPTEEGQVRLAAIPDVAVLKLGAIVGRKEEKDFRDIHELLSRYPLATLLAFYRERVPHHDLRLVIDHLAAAPAADRQAGIVLLRDVDYEKVASDILQAIQHHLADLKDEQTKLAEARLQQRLNELHKKPL
jgi:predicted nucleotidyltransferase